jgi:hypothetical protein
MLLYKSRPKNECFCTKAVLKYIIGTEKAVLIYCNKKYNSYNILLFKLIWWKE